jgi:hypothetical protein
VTLSFLEWLVPQSSRPNWLQNSLSRPLLEWAAQLLPEPWNFADQNAAMIGTMVAEGLTDLAAVSIFIDLLAAASRRWRLRRFERKNYASIA